MFSVLIFVAVHANEHQIYLLINGGIEIACLLKTGFLKGINKKRNGMEQNLRISRTSRM